MVGAATCEMFCGIRKICRWFSVNKELKKRCAGLPAGGNVDQIPNENEGAVPDCRHKRVTE